MLSTRITAAAVLMAGLLAAGTASAQSRVWNFGDQTAPGSCPTAGGSFPVSYGNTLSCSMQPSGTTTTLVASAFTNTASSGTTYATSALNYWGTGSGIGSYNQIEGTSAAAPDHAIDNNGTGSDMVLLSFTSAEVLKQVTLGWSHTDSDFQVLRWTGGALTAIAGRTATQLLSDGWALVTSVDGGNTGNTDTTYNINSTNVSSSYWLISAYNSAFGGANNTAGVDGFKMLSVAAAGAISAPGTLALAGLGLFVAGAVRRRQTRVG